MFDPLVNFKPYTSFQTWCTVNFNSCFPTFSDNLSLNNDVCLSKERSFTQFKEKTILILGGGPSTLDFDLSRCEEYDHVWSMNHFFRNSNLADIRCSLISLSPENNLSEAGLVDYIEKHKPLVGFEPRARWRIPYNIAEVRQFSKNKDCFAFMTYFGGKNGIGPRLVNLAAEAKAKEVHFIGLDGLHKIQEKVHAFEKGKTNLPAGVDNNNAYIVSKTHYELFWQRMLNTYPDTRFVSLQKENHFHDTYLK